MLTFEGEIGDPTAAGNTCDDANDTAGCINSQKLRVDDLSAAEISAAAAGAVVPSGGAGNVTASPAAAAISNSTATGNTSCNLSATGGAASAGQEDKAAKKAEKEAKKTAKDAAKKAKTQTGDSANQAGAVADDSAQMGAVTGATGASGNVDFGSYADASIVFGIPSDGRKEEAFEAADLTNFPHGSALASGVITSFICDQLTNKCKANAAAVTQCDAAAAAAKPLKGQAAADAFNSGLGL